MKNQIKWISVLDLSHGTNLLQVYLIHLMMLDVHDVDVVYFDDVYECAERFYEA